MDKIYEVQKELHSFEKALDEAHQRLLSFEDKANSMFERLKKQAKRSSLFLEEEDLYEVHVAGEKRIVPSSYVRDTLRKKKERYDLWINEETREVRINNEEINPGTNVYKLLVHVAKKVGKFSLRSEFFSEVWDFKGPDKNLSHTIGLRQMFSRYIYKYGRGILKNFIKGEKRGYHIDKKLNFCLISRKGGDRSGDLYPRTQ